MKSNAAAAAAILVNNGTNKSNQVRGAGDLTASITSSDSIQTITNSIATSSRTNSAHETISSYQVFIINLI